MLRSAPDKPEYPALTRIGAGTVLGLLCGIAQAQVHITQPFSFAWDWQGPVDRFELKLDAGLYSSVGLPASTAGTYKLLADPALAGSHSAVVRACTVAAGCTGDSNLLAFVVDAPIAPPPSAQALMVAVGGSLPLPPPPPPPPAPTESPNLTKVTQAGVGSIQDKSGSVWTLGPKNPAVEGGVEFQIVQNGIGLDGAATYLCYFSPFPWAFSVGNWYQWNGSTFNGPMGAGPAGC